MNSTLPPPSRLPLAASRFPLPPRRFPRGEAGSAIITVLMFSFVLLLLVASVLQWSVTERRLNSRSGTWLEARNAAEAVAEYGCYLVAQGFATKMNPTFGTSGTNPVSFPSSIASTFFAGSNVDQTTIDLRAGSVTNVPSTGLYYVDSNDPNNRFDPMVGRYVFRRDVTVVSKVSVNSATGAPVTAFIEEKVSVRGAPLLAYAIFYSANDLEFGESPQMDIYGPVHVNGNLFVGPVGTAALSFHGPVTASGNVYHAWRGTSSTAQEGSNTINSSTAVNFSTDNTFDGTPTSMRTSGGTWKDSTMGADSSTSGLASLQALITPAISTSFNQYASQTWHGNLQTAAMGIQPANPMGFGEQVGVTGTTPILATDPLADDGSNVGTGSGYGHGYGPHSLIEPSKIQTPPATTDAYYAAKTAIEEQKFANKAGLYIKVDVSSTLDASGDENATITIYGDPHSGPGGTPVAGSPNGGLQLGTVPSNVVQYIKQTHSGTTTGSGGNRENTHGLHDNHQNKDINLVQIDMAALKTAITNMHTGGAGTVGTDFVKTDNTRWGNGTADTGFDQYTTSSTGWNGGIYVEVNVPSTSTKQTAVLLANGKIATGGTLMPTGAASPNNIVGLTVATNAPVYVLGNFNANGTVTTGSTNNSALFPDDSPGTAVTSSVEAPVAIAADAVTVLSDNYFGTGSSGTNTNLAPKNTDASPNSSSSNASDSSVELAPTASGDVEIAAALITGTIPTSPDSSGTQQYSGGVHNLPRFLENFTVSGTQKTVAIRGSLVSMFNSRIQTAGWAQAYYSAPIRRWGFDQIFANGKFPPIVPRVLTYRRVDFTYISNLTAYNTRVSSL